MKKRTYLWFVIIAIFLSGCNALTQPPKNLIYAKENIIKVPIKEENQTKEIQKPLPLIKHTKTKKNETNKAFNTFINSEILKHSNVSFYAVNIKTGKVVHDYRSEIALTPASIMKIITSATALEVLTPNDTLETKLLYDGKINNNKKLIGNIYILGGGDPTLGSDGISKNKDQFIKDWIKAIKNKGITSISGNIIVLDNLFGYDGIPKTWLWEDMGTAYAPGTYGISVFDNIYTLYLKSGKPRTTPKILKIVPKINGLTFENKSTVSLKGRRDISVRGIPLSNKRFILGEVPANQEKISVRSDIPNPGLFLGQYFANALNKNSIKFKGKIKTSRTTNKKPKNPKLLAVTKSVPISKIVNILLTRSDNHYTESLYHILQKDKGINVIDYWKDKGMDIGALTMKDGCGLSRGDTLSTKLLVNILSYMSKNDNFKNLLPIAGKEGTVSDFLNNTPLQGHSHIKSGSMNGIQSYAGYIENNNNEYAFAIVVNHWNGKRTALKKEIEILLNNLF